LKALLYFHTLRYLRPIQFLGRARRLLPYRPPRGPVLPLRPRAGRLRLPPVRRSTLLGPAAFAFLGQTATIRGPADWNDPRREKLWLYNLHYFDDLDAAERESRRGWHRALIERWVHDNPPGRGVGWEPYPLSLRAVNWIRWAIAGNELSPNALESLANQLRHLYRRLEYDLLGNHLLANVKALIFGGSFFEGAEAGRWLRHGLRILRGELAEQILSDGGHFERSPMYHCIVLEDLLQLVELAEIYPGCVTGEDRSLWRELAGRMLGWLEAMCHPDGQIALFNDAAQGIALAPAVLVERARMLGIAPSQVIQRDGVTILGSSGFVRVSRGEFVLISDVGAVGPDYNPGHAHAETLSFELSWRGRRILTNSGISTYAGSPRTWERSTAAHNTVEIDSQDSSEVWNSFRVARRARVFGLQVRAHNDRVVIACAHDGYRRLPGRPIHRREMTVAPDRVSINDTVEGGGGHVLRGWFHVHPDQEVERKDEHFWRIRGPVGSLVIAARESHLERRRGWYGPRFEGRIERPVLVWQVQGQLPIVREVTIELEREERGQQAHSFLDG
jgi:uncharacterized heparinase superfamily protein